MSRYRRQPPSGGRSLAGTGAPPRHRMRDPLPAERRRRVRRLSHMRADRRAGTNPRVRALALLLACPLGLAAPTAGRTASGHKHAPRGVSAVAATADDHLPGLHRTDVAGDAAPRTPVAALTRGGGGTADASTPVSARTAQSPPARGPPAKAAV